MTDDAEKPSPLSIEERFRALIEHSADAISLVDARGTILYESPSYSRIMGYTEESRLGGNAFDLVHPEDGPYLARLFGEVLQKTGPTVIEPVRVRHGDGTWHWIEGVANNMLHVPAVNAVVVNFRDITERRQTELALIESETRLRTLSDNLAGGMVYQVDTGTRGEQRIFTYVSAGVERLHGVTQAEAGSDASFIYDQIFEADRPMLAILEAEAIENMRPFRAECRVQMPSGEIRWSYFASCPRKLSNGHLVWDGIEIDITEKEKLRESSQRADKLEALGLLAGGIAHDFNNLLSGIYGYIDLAISVSADAKLSEHLLKTLGTMDRARTLTRQLLTFSKGGAPILKVESLSPFLKETVQFALSGSNVSCAFNLPNDMWACEFDRNQTAQVIENLVINAQQAMPLGGTISVSTQNLQLSERDHPQLPEGRYIRISIVDAGIGIPAENLPRIFDPFFTTKSKGHGLGLATCYSIIKRHGGTIDVTSQLGAGTTFHVYLPATAAVPDHENPPTPDSHRGDGVALIMDDEPVILDTLKALLQSMGYTVKTSRDGAEAIETYKQQKADGNPVSLMFFDLTVAGGMGGKEAAEKIRRIDATVPIVVFSGYADDPAMAAPTEYGFNAGICKPFSRAELSEVLNKVFSGVSNSSND